MKKKTLILLVSSLAAIAGIVAMTKNTEWELEVEFKAKSEKQVQLGQHNAGQENKEIPQP